MATWGSHVVMCIALYTHVYHYTPRGPFFLPLSLSLAIYAYIHMYTHNIHMHLLYLHMSHFTFLDGYCSTVQGLLDWFEVDLGFTELLFIQTHVSLQRWV